MKIRSKVRQAGFSGCIAFGFFGVFALAGIGMFYFLTVRPIANILAARSWVETECAILTSQVAVSHSSDGSTYSVDVTYEYEVDLQTYRGDRYDWSVGSSSGYAGKAKVVEAHPPGAEVTCYVDPDDPTRSVINRSPGHFLWWGLFPLPFLAVGVGGLVFFAAAGLTSRARRGARSGVARRRRLPGLRSAKAPPPAPDRRGRLVLDPGQRPLARLIGITVFAVIWNGVVSVFIFAVIVPSFKDGDPEWFVTLFMVPFALVGLLTISGLVYQLLAMFNPRPRLTLADGHLTPGAEVGLSWHVGGSAGRLDSLVIELEGRESARYRSGKNTRTVHHVFHTAEVLRETGLSRFGAQNRGDGTLRIPRPTMPSFDSGNNKIAWTLKVRGDIPVWPDMIQDFPVTVYPA